ncbi:solute carrier family 25 member 45-like [Tubulanus polymorphus]|uniref:solute carrier family 25 member 45-like n=1 Tax=Tubulanus polymorphus TaxID=672921 RepID=UPI003DA1DF07
MEGNGVTVNDYVAGAFGGLAGLLVGHPFDTTKVNYQVDKSHGKTTVHVIRTIGQHGLAHGFFRGLGLPLVSYGVVNSVFFGVYSNTLNALEDGRARTTPCYRNIVLAGFTGGIAQVFIACPTEVIKVRLQSQVGRGGGVDHHMKSKNYDKGPIDCFKNLYQQGGLRRVYRGFTINAIRDLPASAAYWVVYTWFMEQTSTKFDKHGIMCELVSGGMAGVLSWYMIMPFDVIKSRMQADTFGTKYANTIDCVKQSYKLDGIRVFMKGSLVTALRAFPVNAATMLVYQKCMLFFNANKINV